MADLDVSDCVFCGIVAGTEPATIVGTWPDVMAFAEIDPLAPGHTLVIPKGHMTKASDGAYDFSKVMRRAAEVSANFAASNIIVSNGRAAKQSVEHLHVHVIPRAEGDGLMLPWGTTGNPHDPHWCRVAERYRDPLAELVRLKDGPRDEGYRAAKDAAWEQARHVLNKERTR